jgi:hypothetical protein
MEMLQNDTGRDLVFTSYDEARKFGNLLARAGLDLDAISLKRQLETAGLSEKDGDSIYPPARVTGGQDLQERLRDRCLE